MQPEDIKLLKKKIGRAGGAMLKQFKFFDGYLKSLKLHITDDIKITDKACVKTDERKIYFNKDFAENISGKDIQFILAHEILHIALNHTKRFGQGDIDMQCANVAADLEINQLLRQAKMQVPESAYLPEHFGVPRNKSAETYYDVLKMMKATMDETIPNALKQIERQDDGQGQPQEHNFAEEKTDEQEYDSNQIRTDLNNFTQGKKSLSDYKDIKLDKNYDTDNRSGSDKNSQHNPDKSKDKQSSQQGKDDSNKTEETDTRNSEAGEKENKDGDADSGTEGDDKGERDTGSGSDEQDISEAEDWDNVSDDSASDGADGDNDDDTEDDADGQAGEGSDSDNSENENGEDSDGERGEGDATGQGDNSDDGSEGDKTSGEAGDDDSDGEGDADKSGSDVGSELSDDGEPSSDSDDVNDSDSTLDGSGMDADSDSSGEEEVDVDADADEFNGDAENEEAGDGEETMESLMEGEDGAGESSNSERLEGMKIGTAIQHAIELEDDYKSINPHVEIANFLPYAGVYHGLTDYSFMLPNSRMDGVSEDIIFPSMVGGSPHIACCIDVSVSMSLYEIMVCLSVVKKLTEEVSSIRLILCNYNPIEIGHVTQHDFDEIISRKLKVGGGTDMTKAMLFLQAEEKYDAIFILSDGETPYGKVEQYSDNIIFYITKPEHKRPSFPVPAHVKWRKLWD